MTKVMAHNVGLAIVFSQRHTLSSHSNRDLQRNRTSALGMPYQAFV